MVLYEFDRNSHPFVRQYILDHPNCEKKSTFALLAPVIDANRHEAAVLVGEHAFLEMGESTGVGYRFAVAIVAARLVLTASGGINKMQIFLLLHQGGVGHLMQASGCHRADAQASMARLGNPR